MLRRENNSIQEKGLNRSTLTLNMLEKRDKS